MSESKRQSVESPMLNSGKGTQLNSPGFTPAPVDRFNLVYSIFYLLGLGTLLPWNFFITAQGYWMYKFRELSEVPNVNFTGNATTNVTGPTSPERSDLQITFTSYLSMAAMVPSTIFLMLSTILSRRIPLQVRFIVSLVIVIIFFVVTVVMVKLDTDSWQRQFFAFTLFTVVIINCNTAIFQGAVFGVGGIFPPQITQAVMSGQALGGIFASVVNIISILGGTSPVDSAFGFFLAALVTLIITLIAILNLSRFDYYVHYMGKKEAKGTELTPVTNRSKSVPFLHIFLKIKIYAISVCTVFFVTLSVFPAITVLVESMDIEEGYEWNVKYFIPVGCFLIFNVGDYTGRMLAGWFSLPRTKLPIILFLCLARFAFIPLFMYCNAIPKTYTTVAFGHDAYYLLFMILFSVSGGYLASQAMMFGPKEAEMEHQEAAGMMMAFFLGLGLMLGALCSKLVLMLL